MTPWLNILIVCLNHLPKEERLALQRRITIMVEETLKRRFDEDDKDIKTP